MEQLVNLKTKLENNYKDRDKEQLYKFSVSYENGFSESADILDKHGIELRKPSQTIVLCIEPKELDRLLKLAEEMGFIDAYKQNPRNITQPVELVIKRMAKFDSIGVSYKNEEGLYASFIFSQRAFDHIISQVEGTVKKNENQTVENVDLEEVKDCALRLLEEFDMVSETENVYKRLNEISDKGLGVKEMLIEAFKVYGGNKEFLISKIDEVLANSSELKRRKSA